MTETPSAALVARRVDKIVAITDPATVVLNDAPKRIQRQRTKGWTMPEGAVYVGRPTVWGNIWRPQDAAAWFPQQLTKRQQVEWAVAQYRRDAEQRQIVHYDLSEANAVPLPLVPTLLGGRDLACWCPLDMPCHADLLLAWANPTTTQGESHV